MLRIKVEKKKGEKTEIKGQRVGFAMAVVSFFSVIMLSTWSGSAFFLLMRISVFTD